MSRGFSVEVLCKEDRQAQRIRHALLDAGMTVLDASNKMTSGPQPDVVLVGVSDERSPLPPLVMDRDPGGPGVVFVLGEGVRARVELVSRADDFICEPLDEGELASRVRLVFERRAAPTGGEVLRAGEIVVDLERYEARAGGVLLDLTPKEYELLCYLMRQAGRACRRQRLLEAVWGYDYFGGTRTVDIHVQRLRAKLGSRCGATIETLRGVGYRLRG